MLPDSSDNHNNHDNQTPYAIAKLEECMRVIKQTTNELPVLRNRLDKNKDDKAKAREVYGDLQQQYRKLLNALDSVALALLEMDEQDTADYTVRLSQSIKGFNLMTPNYTKLCTALSEYIAKLPISETPEAKTTNAAIIGRLMSTVKMGYYPTKLEHVKHIVRGIEFPEGVTTNLLDPCCGCGLALRALAQSNNCFTYGIELDRHRAEEAQERLHRVGFGSYFHSRISHEAFHVMLLNPPYLWTITEGGNNTRSEKRFLVDSLYHLMYGGLLIYIIPFHRLTADICRVLCDNFSDLTVWKFERAEFKRFRQIAVIGVRQKRRDGSDMVTALSSLALSPGELPELSELPENRYQLPAIVKKVELFKGAEFNVHELAEQLRYSASFSRMFEKNRLDGAAHHPLLPLSVGQIGLIGGSGLINGLVECEYPHILKGRVVKANAVVQEENLNNKGVHISTTLTETRSNRMVFNILTPQGFISLTDFNGRNTDYTTDSDYYDEPEDCASSGQAVAATNTHVSLGQLVVTANARNALTDTDINNAIIRHQSGDWGLIGEADWDLNNAAIKSGDRLLSSYESADGTKFWVITESDRSYTTVLLPSDY